MALSQQKKQCGGFLLNLHQVSGQMTPITWNRNIKVRCQRLHVALRFERTPSACQPVIKEEVILLSALSARILDSLTHLKSFVLSLTPTSLCVPCLSVMKHHGAASTAPDLLFWIHELSYISFPVFQVHEIANSVVIYM